MHLPFLVVVILAHDKMLVIVEKQVLHRDPALS